MRESHVTKLMGERFFPFVISLTALTVTTIEQIPAQTVDSSDREVLQQEIEQRDAQIRNLERHIKRLEALKASPAPNKPPADQTPPEKPAAITAPEFQPGRLEVNEAAAERALERTLAAAGALLVPFGEAEITPSFGYTRSALSTPVLVTEGGEQFLGMSRIRRNNFLADLELRFGLPYDAQLEIGVPYRYVEREEIDSVEFDPRLVTTSDVAGFGNVRVGLAKTVLREKRWWPDLIARITGDTGTGKETANGVTLGGGFSAISGSITALKRQDPLAFLGAFSYTETFEKDDVQLGGELGFALGTVLAASPETSLSLVLVQSFIDEQQVSGRTVAGSSLTQSVLSIGAATILGLRTLLGLSVGIGLTEDSEDYSINLSLPIRFGPPF